ncbi:MAG: M23 family metallopeptidase [Gammaproteobacteria bacterium]
MELLLVSKSRGTAARVRISAFGLCLLALAAGGVTALAGYWGYSRGSDATAELILNSPERSAELWQREIIQQRQFLNRLRRDVETDLNTLSGFVGRLQGDVARLDAVAERVAASSSLDPAEFRFTEAAPIGGPPTTSAAPRWDGLLENLDALALEVERREANLTTLESFLLDRRQRSETQPDGRPVGEGGISSGYGYRTDPVSGRREFHSGVDFAGKPGIEVRAAADGVVTWSGKRWGYGNLVELNHGNGYITRYAHNRANLVALGEKVEKNQPIALLGSSGRSTGPHVHFEVEHNDRSVNPWKFIRRSPQQGKH